MKKEQLFNVAPAYESPRVKVARTKTRRVLCGSLGNGYGNGKASDLWGAEDEGVNDYSNDDLL